MKILFATLIYTLLMFSQQAEAKKSGKGNNKPGKNVWAQIQALQTQVAALEAANPVAQRSVDVDCSAGETLSSAVLMPAQRLDITFAGSCYEDLYIERGNLTLTGLSGSEIQGTVDVDAEVGTVEMHSVYISNSVGTGLNVHSGSNVEAVNLHVNGATGSGIALFNATFECADCSANNNGVSGLTLLFGSRALLAGGIEFNGHTQNGIEVADSSTLKTADDPQSLGASGTTNDIDTSGNGGFAILSYGASAMFFGPNSHVTIHQNSNGALIASGSTSHFQGTLNATENGLGLAALGGSIFLGGALTATDNNIGLFVSAAGKLRGGGTAVTTNNNFGVFVRTGFVEIGSIESQNNVQAAVILQEGAVLRGPTTQVSGNVFCDGTEILNSSFSCGAN